MSLRVKHFVTSAHKVTHSWDNSNAAEEQDVNVVKRVSGTPQQEFLALSNYFPATDLKKSSLQTRNHI
jgi:hypothetical protein